MNCCPVEQGQTASLVGRVLGPGLQVGGICDGTAHLLGSWDGVDGGCLRASLDCPQPCRGCSRARGRYVGARRLTVSGHGCSCARVGRGGYVRARGLTASCRVVLVPVADTLGRTAPSDR